MKSYIGISRDHSGSMQPHVTAAKMDYNGTISGIREAAKSSEIDTIVSVVKCGVGNKALVQREVVNSSVNALQDVTHYIADGTGTPLWDSVGELIHIFEGTPDVNNPEVTFLVMAITDGLENRSATWSAERLRRKIMELQGTDRWSFVFRVPIGYSKALQRLLGISEGNILEWEQTQKGFEKATQVTRTAFTGYYSGLRSGQTSTTRFFSNLAQIPHAEVKRELRDITGEVDILLVKRDRSVIREFCERETGKPYMKGMAFYQVVKAETVQDHKEIVILDKKNKRVYTGSKVRDLLGFPQWGSIRLIPGNHGDYELYVQSTSVNRLLPLHTKVLYLNS